MQSAHSQKPKRLYDFRWRIRIDAVAMLVYVILVYAWALSIYPLGRDYIALAEKGANLPWISGAAFHIEESVFGSWTVGYHLVNAVLLYGCMLCIYLLVNLSIKGPAWIGIFAANLFMANPLHSESVLNLSGVADLLPCLLALAALTTYAWQVEKGKSGLLVLPFALVLLAALPFRINAWLPALFLLYEGLLTGSHQRSKLRIALGLAALVASLAIHAPALLHAHYSLAALFVPLYFTFYCIGFLPETAYRFHTSPWLAWAAVAAVIIAVLWVHRKVRRPAFAFAFLAMVLLRLSPDSRFIDPVHLIGGGQLLVPQALLMFAVAAVYLRVMEHPKWRLPLVYSSFSVSIIFFIMEGVSIWHWREAASQVRAFQAQAQTIGGKGPIGVVPDYQSYAGAPMDLATSISYDTPFGSAIPNRPVLPIHYFPPNVLHVTIETWAPAKTRILTEGKPLVDLGPYRFYVSDNNYIGLAADHSADSPNRKITFTLEAGKKVFPDRYVTLKTTSTEPAAPGKEPEQEP